MRSVSSIQGDFFNEIVYGWLLLEEDELLAIKEQIDLSYEVNCFIEEIEEVILGDYPIIDVVTVEGSLG